MEIRYSPDPAGFARMNTTEIRKCFLVEELFRQDSIKLVYSDVDRAICGGIMPVRQAILLSASDELKADYFCQRRELGVLNVGDAGTITVDGHKYDMARTDCLYIGRGSKEISFASKSPDSPARFYLLSYPAHKEYPTSHIPVAKANTKHLGSVEQANKRTIYQLIHPDIVKSCQLVMGFTKMELGCVWNTMPPHTHERRMEVYMYFGIPDSVRVFHFMGQPHETRHVSMANEQAIICPSWSIHSGVGTEAYTFCWGMGGENQNFDDMDHLAIKDLY